MVKAGPKLLATIAGVKVYQEPSGRVSWLSGAAIDADGANGQNGEPFAYRTDNKGLDLLANAGYPSTKWWRDIFVVGEDGQPVTDSKGGIYSKTAYEWKDRRIETRYVDSASVPYVVTNPTVRRVAKGIVLGCKARVSFNGKSIEAVVADVSPPHRIGELSIAAAKALGIPSNPRSGGVTSGVLFELFPGTPASVGGETYELQPA